MPEEKEQPIEAKDVDLYKEEEMLPKGAKQVSKPSTEGDEPDTAGEHGKMAPEAAKGLQASHEEE